MQIIGLLGGVASGKSLVARLWAERGAGRLDADRGGHEVLRLPEVEAAARDRWGEGIFAADGHIDRARLAAIVFGPPPAGPTERAFLEQMTHPRIACRIEQQARDYAAGGCSIAVLDAPLLLEAGWDRLCSKLIYVEAPDHVRCERAMARGWTREQYEARQRAQGDLEEKRRRADFVIDNSGDEEQTRRQVEEIARQLEQ